MRIGSASSSVVAVCIALLFHARVVHLAHEQGVGKATSADPGVLGYVHLARNTEELAKAARELSRNMQRNSSRQALPSLNYLKSSRGIVISAGGREMLANAVVHILVMRGTHNCSLPVEVAHYGSKEADKATLAMLQELPQVAVIDMAKQPYPAHIYKPKTAGKWVKKVLALYHSSFDQVLFLDADSQPLVDPTPSFEWNAFKQHGSYFWPDYWPPGGQLGVKEGAYTIFGLNPPWVEDLSWRAIDSGQFLFDRKRHADVLDWLLFLNVHGLAMSIFMYGDKDTFELAFTLAGKHAAFYRTRYWLRTACSNLRKDNHYWHTGIVQNAPDGMPAFYHRASTCCKWTMKTPADTWIVPVFLTPPIDLKALQTSTSCRDGIWDDSGCFPAAKMIQPGNATCDQLDLATLLMFEKHDPKRWGGCRPREEVQQAHVPVPLLPVEWFPPQLTKTITASLAALQAVQEHLANVRGSSKYTKLLHLCQKDSLA